MREFSGCGLLVQAYFAQIVLRTLKTRPALRFLWICCWVALAVGSLVGAVGTAACFLLAKRGSSKPKTLLLDSSLVFYGLWLSSATALDLALATILVARFLRDIRRDGFNSTNRTLSALAMSTLESVSLPTRRSLLTSPLSEPSL